MTTQSLSPEQIGRNLASAKLVHYDPDDRHWKVYRDKYDHSGATVSASHSGLWCEGYFCRNKKCKHIWAVEFYMGERGEQIVLPHVFESHIPYLNEILRRFSFVRLVPFRDGWLIDDSASEEVPFSEWGGRNAKKEISRLVDPVIAHATEAKAKIFIKVDHNPYSGEIFGRDGEPIGTDAVIDILVDKGFRSIDNQGGVEVFLFDPQYLRDPSTPKPKRPIMPRTEALDGPIQSARHAKAIYAKLLRHKGFADRSYLRLHVEGRVGLMDEYPTVAERYERNKRIADECEERILAWIDGLIETEKKHRR